MKILGLRTKVRFCGHGFTVTMISRSTVQFKGPTKLAMDLQEVAAKIQDGSMVVEKI